MSTILNDQTTKQAAEHLANADPVLAPVIARYGPCTIRPHRNYYQALAGEIIGQQLSVKAAASIRKRFEGLFGDIFPEPKAILEKSVDELRAAGLSGAKAKYIRDLAQHIVDDKVKFDHLDNLSNDEIIAELTDVKGIGEWTVHMFLMFCMGRADVLAPGDLGIRNAIKKLYNLKDVPSPDQVTARAKRNHWRPYETVACWYLWQSLENVPT
ncbi:MAG TPA: DNA-3-methyladenine glycosylase [Candidatus Saccharimonadales bacterium]|jgi:DNA-3-methyladenine glycosylase II